MSTVVFKQGPYKNQGTKNATYFNEEIFFILKGENLRHKAMRGTYSHLLHILYLIQFYNSDQNRTGFDNFSHH